MNISYPYLSYGQSSQSSMEEWANSLTHGLGLLLSIGGLSVLVVQASIYGTAWHIVGSSVYGATLALLYAASTIYHITRSPERKHKLRTIEQAFIFLFIAGTYTPFALATLSAGWGWSIFGVAWGLAVAGIILNTLYFHRLAAASNLMYLGTGWLCLVAIVPLQASLPAAGLLWLLVGGTAYSIGVIVLCRRSIPFNHAIWHLSVLAGSACHYFAILLYVLPS